MFVKVNACRLVTGDNGVGLEVVDEPTTVMYLNLSHVVKIVKCKDYKREDYWYVQLTESGYLYIKELPKFTI
jgi:hypothetical protein